jgi:tetratricopeptide (TPR) repeat protein
MRQQYYILFLFLIFTVNIEAQEFTKDIKPDPKFAKYCILFNNYIDGLKEYKMLLSERPQNVEYHIGAAICYLNLYRDKQKAVEHLEWVIKQKKFDEKAYYYLGQAYLQTYRFDSAITMFEKYLSVANKDENRITAKRMIEICNNAKELTASPDNVEISNLGKYINTKYPEFNPYIPSNETMIVFNSQRKSNLGNYAFYDGYYPSDIYFSYFKFGKWKKARRLNSAINSTNIEKVVGLTGDGSQMFFIKEDIKGNKETYYSKKRGKYYRQPEPVFIKDADYEKIYSLTISPDNKYLIFSAEHKGGYGGKDLYLSFRMPNGYWSNASLLDSTVNTQWDEDYPYFSPDGRYFFFASEGHKSMGGFDIFKARWVSDDSTHIRNVANLGYPVNTPLDDKTISLSKSGRYGYIASFRNDGFGDLDIYRVIFKDEQPRYSVIRGAIYGPDSTRFDVVIKRINDHIDTLNFPVNREYKRLLLKKKDTAAAYAELAKKIPYEKINVKIIAINKETGETFGNFIARNDTANYSVILPPGRWKLIFKRQGYDDYIIDDLVIEERDRRNRMINKNVVLTQKAD